MNMSSRPVVVDASVAICVLLGEPGHEAVEHVLGAWASVDRRVVVPAQFWLEVVNRLSREAGTTGAGTLAAVHHLDTFSLETVDVDRALVLRVIDVTERFGLTAYDALYLAVAESLDAELATLDRALASAAGERAVPLGDEHRLHEAPAVYEHDVTWPRYPGAGAYLAQLRAEALRDYERSSRSAVPGPRR
jgi:predicted nucleic acid-binding protein